MGKIEKEAEWHPKRDRQLFKSFGKCQWNVYSYQCHCAFDEQVLFGRYQRTCIHIMIKYDIDVKIQDIDVSGHLTHHQAQFYLVTIKKMQFL